MNTLITHIRRNFRARSILNSTSNYRYLKLSIVQPNLIRLYEDLVYQSPKIDERLSFIVLMIMIKDKRPKNQIEKMIRYVTSKLDQFQNFMTITNIMREMSKVPELLTRQMIVASVDRSIQLFDKACRQRDCKYRNRDSIIIFEFLGLSQDFGELGRVLDSNLPQNLAGCMHEIRSKFLFGFLDILAEGGFQDHKLSENIMNELEEIEICLGESEFKIIETNNFKQTITNPRFQALCDRLKNALALTKKEKLNTANIKQDIEPIM